MIQYIEPRLKNNSRFYLFSPNGLFLGEILLDKPDIKIMTNDFNRLTFQLPEKINGKDNPRLEQVLHNFIIEVHYGDLDSDIQTRIDRIQKSRFIITKTPKDFSDNITAFKYEAISTEFDLNRKFIYNWAGVERSEFSETFDTIYNSIEPVVLNQETGEVAKNFYEINTPLINDIDLISISQLQDFNGFTSAEPQFNKTFLLRYRPYNEDLMTAQQIEDDLTANLIQGMYYYYPNENKIKVLVPDKIKKDGIYIDNYFKYEATYRHELSEGEKTGLTEVKYKTTTSIGLKEAIEDLVANTGWTVNNIDPDLDLLTRSDFKFDNISIYNSIKNLIESFGAIIEFNDYEGNEKQIDLYLPENYGVDLGLTLEYGKYIQTISKDDTSENIITKIKAIGKGGMTLAGYTYDGKDHYYDFSYYIDGLTWNGTNLVDKNGYIDTDSEFTPSRWMSNELVKELLKIKALEENYHDEIYGSDTYTGLLKKLEEYYIDVISKQEELIEKQYYTEKYSALSSSYHNLEDIEKVPFDSILKTYNGIEYSYPNYLSTIRLDSINQFKSISSEIDKVYQKLGSYDGSSPILDFNERGSGNFIEGYIDVVGGAQTTIANPSKVLFEDSNFSMKYFKYTDAQVYVVIEDLNYNNENGTVTLVADRPNGTLSIQLSTTEQQLDLNADVFSLRYDASNITGNYRVKIRIVDNTNSELKYGINQINERLNYIYNLTSYDGLSAELKEELKPFIQEKIFTDKNIETGQELFEKSKNYLSENSSPKVTVGVSIIDILSAGEAYQDWDKIVIGDKLNIYFPKFNIDASAQIKEISFAPQDNKLDIIISNVENYTRNPIRRLGDNLRNINETNDNTVQVNDSILEEVVDNVDELNDSVEASDTLNTGGQDINGENTVRTEDGNINIYETIVDPLTDSLVVRGESKVSIGASGIYITDIDGNIKSAINATGVSADILKGKVLLGDRLLITTEDDSVYVGKWFEGQNEDYGIYIVGELKDDDNNPTGVFSRTTISRDKGFLIEKSNDGNIYTPTVKIDNEGNAEFSGTIKENAIFDIGGVKRSVEETLRQVEVRIVGGNRSFMYDPNIENPVPATPGMYTAEVYVDGVLTTTDVAYQWASTGVISTSGMTDEQLQQQTFIPSITSGLLLSSTVSVTVTYGGVEYFELITIVLVTQGTGGAANYTWVRYSDEIPVNGMLPIGNSFYEVPTENTKSMGMAFNKGTNDSSASTYTDYSWTEIVGETGASGAPGADAFGIITDNANINLIADQDGVLLSGQSDLTVKAFLYQGQVQIKANASSISNYVKSITMNLDNSVSIVFDETQVATETFSGSFVVDILDNTNSDAKVGELTIYFVKVTKGQDAINVFLTNENGSILADQFGDIVLAQSFITEIKVYKYNQPVVVNSITFSNAINCNASEVGGIITINSNIGTYQQGSIEINANTDEGTFTKVFTFNVTSAGEDAYNLSLSNETAAIPADQDGNVVEGYSEITDIKLTLGQNILNIDAVGTTVTIVATECSASRTGNTITVDNFTANYGTVEVTIEVNGNTLTKVFNYTKANKGAEAVGAFLTNDNETISTQLLTGYPTNELTTRIVVDSRYTISVSNANNINGMFQKSKTVINNYTHEFVFDTISADMGSAEIEIVLTDGTIITKVFNFSLTRKGATGDGNTAIFITNENTTIRVYEPGSYISDASPIQTVVYMMTGDDMNTIVPADFEITYDGTYTLTQQDTYHLLLTITGLTTDLTKEINIVHSSTELGKILTINQDIDWDGLTEIVDGLPELKGSKVVAGSIAAKQIASKTITAEEIEADSITSEELVTDNIYIGSGAMTIGKLGTNNYGVKLDNNGKTIILDENGLIANNGETNTFVIDSNGDATFSGTLSAATGDFSGTITASGGTIGGITIDDTKIYVGTGAYGNSNTGFYLDNSGKFSLKDKLVWNGTKLTIDGDGTFSGDISGSSGKFGSANYIQITTAGELKGYTGTTHNYTLSDDSLLFNGVLGNEQVGIDGNRFFIYTQKINGVMKPGFLVDSTQLDLRLYNSSLDEMRMYFDATTNPTAYMLVNDSSGILKSSIALSRNDGVALYSQNKIEISSNDVVQLTSLKVGTNGTKIREIEVNRSQGRIYITL